MSNQPQQNNNLNILDRVRLLLNQNHPREAMDLVRQSKDGSKAMQNAYGVCLMRLGETDKAVKIYRELLLRNGGMTISSDVPTIFKINFATALLLTGNLDGCNIVLHDMKDEQNPNVVKLRQAISTWKKSLGLFRRLLLPIYTAPKKEVQLNYPPGDL